MHRRAERIVSYEKVHLNNSYEEIVFCMKGFNPVQGLKFKPGMSTRA